MSTVKITWLGHSAFMVEGKNRIVIDPFLTGNPMAASTPDKIRCDIICVTHGHGDHVGDTVQIAKKNKAKVLAMVELAGILEKAGCDATGFNVGGSVKIGETTITMTAATHSSGTEEQGFEGAAGTPAGYVIDSGKTVYHAGDTGLFCDMSLIGELYPLDVALLPIGGFYTMDVVQAAKAVELLKPKIAIPMHFNTWPPIKADPVAFKSLVEKKTNTQVKILKPGESLTV
ncbi:MAG: metal-dependent hydrolase [Thermoplasmata archaeon]